MENILQNKINEWLKPFTEDITSGKLSKDVMLFIAEFNVTYSDGSSELLNTFRDKYCYYFAEILRTVFCGGTIVLASPTRHIVWEDATCQGYDICGPYDDYCISVPIMSIGDEINYFKHIPGDTTKLSIESQVRLINMHASCRQDIIDALLGLRNGEQVREVVKTCLMENNYAPGNRFVDEVIQAIPAHEIVDEESIKKLVTAILIVHEY